MKLSSHRVSPQVAVSDMARAREFYEGKLGLSAGRSPNERTVAYPCGSGTALHVYESPAHAGKATGTVARWDVDDLDRAVDDLTRRGVAFEQYDEPVETNAKGIHDSGYGRVAWFKDPDGNVFALEEVG
jgi:catechol 2,3-dioxygenase-like lactoylglutathione lyase family enzyme